MANSCARTGNARSSVARRASRWASRWRARRISAKAPRPVNGQGGELVGWEGLIGRVVPGALLRGSTDRRDGIQSPPLLRPVRTGARILFVDGCRAVLPPLVRPLKELAPLQTKFRRVCIALASGIMFSLIALVNSSGVNSRAVAVPSGSPAAPGGTLTPPGTPHSLTITGRCVSLPLATYWA